MCVARLVRLEPRLRDGPELLAVGLGAAALALALVALLRRHTRWQVAVFLIAVAPALFATPLRYHRPVGPPSFRVFCNACAAVAFAAVFTYLLARTARSKPA